MTKTLKIVAVCSQCEKPITKGERVWFKGRDYYCNGKCLTASFNTKNMHKGDE